MSEENQGVIEESPSMRKELLECAAMDAVQRYINGTTSVTLEEMIEACCVLIGTCHAVADGLTANEVTIESEQIVWTPEVKKIITPDKRIET